MLRGSRMCASILGMRANQLGASRILVRSCPVTLLAGITYKCVLAKHGKAVLAALLRAGEALGLEMEAG